MSLVLRIEIILPSLDFGQKAATIATPSKVHMLILARTLPVLNAHNR